MTTLTLITAFLGNLGTGEILIVAFLILLLFGGKKIPELMRGIGKGVRNFRQGMNDITDEITNPAADEKSGSRHADEKGN